VVFNAGGVHLATELGKGEVCVTTIGHATPNRLFSFDQADDDAVSCIAGDTNHVSLTR